METTTTRRTLANLITDHEEAIESARDTIRKSEVAIRDAQSLVSDSQTCPACKDNGDVEHRGDVGWCLLCGRVYIHDVDHDRILWINQLVTSLESLSLSPVQKKQLAAIWDNDASAT